MGLSCGDLPYEACAVLFGDRGRAVGFPGEQAGGLGLPRRRRGLGLEAVHDRQAEVVQPELPCVLHDATSWPSDSATAAIRSRAAGGVTAFPARRTRSRLLPRST